LSRAGVRQKRNGAMEHHRRAGEERQTMPFDDVWQLGMPVRYASQRSSQRMEKQRARGEDVRHDCI